MQTGQLLIAERFRKDANIITHYTRYPLCIFLPFNLSSILTACFSIQRSLLNPSVPCPTPAGAFAAQTRAAPIPALLLPPRPRTNLHPIPGSHRRPETPSSSHPLQAGPQPSCDSPAASLCLWRSAASYCRIISLLESFPSSASRHKALWKRSYRVRHTASPSTPLRCLSINLSGRNHFSDVKADSALLAPKIWFNNTLIFSRPANLPKTCFRAHFDLP